MEKQGYLNLDLNGFKIIDNVTALCLNEMIIKKINIWIQLILNYIMIGISNSNTKRDCLKTKIVPN